MVKERLDFLMVLLILFLVMIYEPRITFNQGLIITDDIFASDLMNDRYPVRVELGRQIKKGKIPLWTDLIYNGFPLQANPESGITYPLNLILFRIFSPAQALNISILLKFFLSAFFLYIFLRMIRIDPFASLFGAVAFSWCGFFVVHLKHLNMHDAGIWLPLLLILIEKYKNSSRPTWVLLISFVLGLQILAGHPQISYYTVLFLIIYFLWQKLPDAKEMVGRVRLVVICGLMIILGLGLGMIQLLPGKELTDLSERSGGVTYQFATQYPYYLPDLLTFIFPYINGDPGQGTYVKPGIFWEDYGYVGLLPLFFAFYAMVKTIKKNRYTRFWTLTLIISLILMLGDQAVLYKFLFYILPGMNYFRFSTRFILFVDLSLSILAAIGVAQALNRRGKIAYMIVIVLTIADLFIMHRRQNPVVAKDEWERVPHTAQMIRQDTSLFRVFSIGGVESHKIAFSRAAGWSKDLTPYIQQRAVLQPSSNILYNIASADGYINLVPRTTVQMWGNEKRRGVIHSTASLSPDLSCLIVTENFINILKAFNVKYLVSIWPIEYPGLKLLKVQDGVWLYQNLDVLPRAYPVFKATSMNDQAASAHLIQGKIDLSRVVIINDSTIPDVSDDTSDGGAGRVFIKTYNTRQIEIEVNFLRKGWLFLSDTYYPGWSARVDGQRVKVYRANICGRAIPLEAGRHQVTFFYQPRSYQIGKLISLLSLFIISVGIFLDRIFFLRIKL